MPQKFFDLVKSSNFCASLKPSFVWSTTEHGESGESKAVTSIPERKLRLSQSGLLKGHGHGLRMLALPIET